ncbi:MAG: terpene synthase family protein [Rubrobacter sp.]
MRASAWPGLSYPFPPSINEHSDSVHHETVEWASGLGLIGGEIEYEEVLATNIGRLAGRFHPSAPRERLRLISDWYAWMFFRDDLCDEAQIGRHPDLLAAADLHYLEVLRGSERYPGESRDPLSAAMSDLRGRLVPVVPAALWMRRFVRSVKEHFESTLWEASNRSRNAVPDLETYTRMRPITGGMYVDADFIEITTDIYLPPEVHGHPIVSALTRMSNNAVCWANDVISLRKELARGDVHNLVIVLNEQSASRDLEASKEAAVGMHDREVGKFLRTQKNLPSFGRAIDANLERYVSVLRSRMRGNLDWSLESSRYRAEPPVAG